MATGTLEVLKEASLTNNCPECFNQNLTLSFYQKHFHNRFFHRITPEITQELICNTCKSRIYPVNWTEDIERSVEYYQKAVQPEKATIRFSPLFYILVLLVVTLIGTLSYLYLNGIIQV